MEAFRVNKTTRDRHGKRKRRIERRLSSIPRHDPERPVFSASNIRYELADRGGGIACGGIGLMHNLARRVGLPEAVDRNLSLLKIHRPYQESDHVLNIAYNILAGGHCLENLELLRNDESYLDALAAPGIPDPTTAGDFCRRFSAADVETLMDAINEVRLGVWARQPAAFFEQAVIDVDGTLAPTTGQCKEGMDIAYNGQWGYHPLVVSLANTSEPLFLVNRGGNRPSHDGAAKWLDKADELCRQAGFRRVVFRGDTDFSQTVHLDRWDDRGTTFYFGIDAMRPLVERADALGDGCWQPLKRPAKYKVQTTSRARPANVKEEVVVRRQFKNVRLFSEMISEFAYQPTACEQPYRVVVLCKNLTVSRGEWLLFDDLRYFFYITNDWSSPAEQIVFQANQRCDQENLIAQLKGGIGAMRMPVDALVSNWAYMVMASLAWTLKAWLGLVLPVEGRWRDKHEAQKRSVLRMEFGTFLNAFIRLPCQVVRKGRRLVYRLLSWNPWQWIFLRAAEAVRVLRC